MNTFTTEWAREVILSSLETSIIEGRYSLEELLPLLSRIDKILFDPLSNPEPYTPYTPIPCYVDQPQPYPAPVKKYMADESHAS